MTPRCWAAQTRVAGGTTGLDLLPQAERVASKVRVADHRIARETGLDYMEISGEGGFGRGKALANRIRKAAAARRARPRRKAVDGDGWVARVSVGWAGVRGRACVSSIYLPNAEERRRA